MVIRLCQDGKPVRPAVSARASRFDLLSNAITANQKGRAMRTESEKEWLLKAIDAFGKRFIVVSPEYEILAASRSTNGAFRYNIIGQKCYHVFYDRTAPCLHCAVDEAMERDEPTLRPKPDVGLELGRMPCYYAYPIYRDGQIAAFASMDFDLPTRHGLEEVLQRTNAFLRKLLISAVDAVIAADKKGRILIFNEMAAKILGFDAEKVMQNVDIRDLYPGDGAYDVMKKLRSEDFGGKGNLKSYQVNLKTKSGEAIPISLNAAIVYEDEQEIATIGYFHDMREELHMKEELEKTQLQLLQSEKMASLGKLAAGVAHQLNNPLGGITLFTKLILEEYNLEEGAQKDLQRILKDAERCRDTVKELLEFSRQTKRLKRPHDINRTISRTLFLLENQTLFQNIKIEKNFGQDLPPVNADIQQLNHLFMNIILNAAQAMDGRGAMTISTDLSVDGRRVKVEIADTGPGIPEHIRPRIFEPFFTTKEEGKGTGLGLSLVYGIVENHDGRIDVQSEPGQGTTFVVELPVATQDHEGEDSGEQG
jgi:PAS domain S-box-containing protein